MTFCSNCGASLDGKDKFCVKCGTPVVDAPPAAAAAPPVAPPPPHLAPVYAAPVQSMAMPAGYPPGTVPIMVAAPPQAPAKRSGVGTIVAVVAVAAMGYYFYTHRTPTPPPAPPTPTHQPGENAALVKQQAFSAHWQTENAFIQISNGAWKNNATVPIQSATLECDQFSANGTDLDEMQTTLKGPVPPGTTSTFPVFQMGEVANYLDHVTCTIVHIKQPTPAPAQ
jgi:hypothetical protein